ncbi:uncharacterized protein DS421_11g341290 [Arachis hypogaea]|nr:uncharacterized protein DS421_11g341290 [Arachis hypogaea]
MERRFNRESKGGVSLQKRMIETRRKAEPAPDLTDFMNDMFFGAADIYKKNYDFTGGSSVVLDDEDDVGFDDSTRSNSARLTQEWLQEARRIVSSSPTRSDSPARRCLSGSPRFASPSNNNSQPGASLIPSLDPTRDNNLSRTRSARRCRTRETTLSILETLGSEELSWDLVFVFGLCLYMCIDSLSCIYYVLSLLEVDLEK